MRRLLLGLVFATVLLGSGGVAVEGRHDASAPGADATGHTPPTFRYALLAALETHDEGEGILFEHHHLCADGCSANGAVAAVIMHPYAVALLRTGGPVIPSNTASHPLSLRLCPFLPPR